MDKIKYTFTNPEVSVIQHGSKDCKCGIQMDFTVEFNTHYNWAFTCFEGCRLPHKTGYYTGPPLAVYCTVCNRRHDVHTFDCIGGVNV